MENRKRTHTNPANDQNHHAKKKAKIKHARAIHTQSLKTGPKLPPFLDVEKFINVFQPFSCGLIWSRQ